MGVGEWHVREDVPAFVHECPECEQDRLMRLMRVRYGMTLGVPFLQRRSEKAYIATNSKHAIACTECGELFEITKEQVQRLVSELTQ